MTTSIGDELVAVMHAGEFERAAQLIGPHIEQTRQVFGDDHENMASAFNWLGCIYQVTDRLDEAVIAYERALAIGTDDPTGDLAIMMRANLAETHSMRGDASAAAPLLAEALALHARRTGPAYLGLGGLYQQTAAVSENAGDLDDAERHLLHALRLSADSGIDSLVDEIRIHLCRVLLKRGDFITAAGVRDQVLSRISVDAGWRGAWAIGHLLPVLWVAHESAMTEAGALFVRDSLLAMESHVYDDEPKADERLRGMAQSLENLGELEAAERLRLRAAKVSMLMPANGC